eukprot:14168099-Ditylum_brightwellii.AAC.1
MNVQHSSALPHSQTKKTRPSVTGLVQPILCVASYRSCGMASSYAANGGSILSSQQQCQGYLNDSGAAPHF